MMPPSPPLQIRTRTGEKESVAIGLVMVATFDGKCKIITTHRGSFHVEMGSRRRLSAYAKAHFFTPRGQKGETACINLDRVVSIGASNGEIVVHFGQNHIRVTSPDDLSSMPKAAFFKLADGRFVSLEKAFYVDEEKLHFPGIAIPVGKVGVQELHAAIKSTWIPFNGGMLNPAATRFREGARLYFDDDVHLAVTLLPPETRRALEMDAWPMIGGVAVRPLNRKEAALDS